ncbi:MAG: hypothetical protein HOP21_09545 [Methylotenera sp.]|nr:hypothetical protein [Methylotenera sp.]
MRDTTPNGQLKYSIVKNAYPLVVRSMFNIIWRTRLCLNVTEVFDDIGAGMARGLSKRG